MLTDKELAAMLERYEAATKGPWEVVGFSAADFEGVHTRYVKAGGLEVGSIRFYQNADASLVIHAPDDIPALIAEVRRLREKSGTCTWKYDEWHDYYETECGSAWALTDGTLDENGVVFCHKCGRRVVVEGATDEVD